MRKAVIGSVGIACLLAGPLWWIAIATTLQEGSLRSMGNPLYPMVLHMEERWGWAAPACIAIEGCLLGVCTGLGLIWMAFDTIRHSWYLPLSCLVVGVVLANICGAGIRDLLGRNDVIGQTPHYQFAASSFSHGYPLVTLSLVVVGVMAATVGFFLRNHPAVRRLLLFTPLLVITVYGLLALVMFPNAWPV